MRKVILLIASEPLALNIENNKKKKTRNLRCVSDYTILVPYCMAENKLLHVHWITEVGWFGHVMRKGEKSIVNEGV